MILFKYIAAALLLCRSTGQGKQGLITQENSTFKILQGVYSGLVQNLVEYLSWGNGRRGQKNRGNFAEQQNHSNSTVSRSHSLNHEHLKPNSSQSVVEITE